LEGSGGQTLTVQPPCKVTGRVRQHQPHPPCGGHARYQLKSCWAPRTICLRQRLQQTDTPCLKLPLSFTTYLSPCKIEIQICRIPLCLSSTWFRMQPTTKTFFAGFGLSGVKRRQRSSATESSLLKYVEPPATMLHEVLFTVQDVRDSTQTADAEMQPCTIVDYPGFKVGLRLGRYACHAPVNSLLLDFLGFLDQFFFPLGTCTAVRLSLMTFTVHVVHCTQSPSLHRSSNAFSRKYHAILRLPKVVQSNDMLTRPD